MLLKMTVRKWTFGVMLLAVGVAAVNLALLGVIVYVAAHFIAKYW